MTTTMQGYVEVGLVEADGVAADSHAYYHMDRIALRLEGEHGVVMAALSRDAIRKINELTKETP